MKVNELVCRYASGSGANSPPATPAKNAPTTNAEHLVARGVDAHRLGGDLVLADGEQRAPVAERDQAMRPRRSSTTHQSTTQKKLAVRAGCPGSPRAPPTASMFRISTRMISPKPSVTMAR